MPPSNICSAVGPQEPLNTRTDMSELAALRNYGSVESQKDEAMIEVDSYIDL